MRSLTRIDVPQFAEKPRSSLCARIRSFFGYALMTTGRRALTLLDIATDLRTFTIFYGDPNLAYTSSFLLASICAPFLIFWVSSHNFAEALRAQRCYAQDPPHTMLQRMHRRFYNVMAIPVLGVALTALQLLWWHLVDLVAGTCCQRCHRTEVDALRTRDFRRTQLRRMPRLMPPDAARFFGLLELFFEAIPQTALQLVVYLSGVSDHFTKFDVMTSVGASLLNMLLNMFELGRTAQSLGIATFDYILFFVSGTVRDALREGIPVRRFLRNPTYDELDLSGYKTLFADPVALKTIVEILAEPVADGRTRTILLPRPHRNEEGWCYDRVLDMAWLLVIGRRNPHVHLSTVGHIVDEEVLSERQGIVAPSVRVASKNASRRRRTWGRVRMARRMNRCGLCGTKPGDLLCAVWGHNLDDDITGVRRRRCCCFSSPIDCLRINIDFLRSRSAGRTQEQRLRALVTFLWPLLTAAPDRSDVQVTAALARTVFVYLLVGDLGMLRVIRAAMRARNFESALLADICDKIVGPDEAPEVQVPARVVDDLFGAANDLEEAAAGVACSGGGAGRPARPVRRAMVPASKHPGSKKTHML